MAVHEGDQVVALHAAVALGPAALAAHFLVEGGKEEVLQDGLVVVALFRRIGRRLLEHVLECCAFEQRIRDQTALFDEPYKDQARE
ncbi:hypothetical protein D3C78_1627060 [compost metagenome]